MEKPAPDNELPENGDSASHDESFESAAPAVPGSDIRREPGPVADLPSVDELVARIPASTKTALEELFRAKFVGVRRIRPGDLR